MAGDEQSQALSKITNAAEKAGDTYANSTLARLAVSQIPFVGGAIDILLSGAANKRWQQRVDAFVEDLGHRMKQIEEKLPKLPSDDEMIDFIRAVLVQVAKTRSQSKRDRFANIIVHQVLTNVVWDVAEAAADLLDSLTELDVTVLMLALEHPHRNLENLPVVFLGPSRMGAKEGKPLREGRTLQTDFPDVPAEQLRLACAKLVSRGLLVDEGINRLETGPLELLSTTELALWFSEWICDETGKQPS